MKVLLYPGEDTGVEERLRHVVGGVTAAEAEIEICRDLPGLGRRVQLRKCDLSVVVLCATTAEEFGKVLTLRSVLQDLRLILILPDRESKTISQALSLRPRFMSFTDTDFSDVRAVLAKMLKIYRDTFPVPEWD